MQMARRTCSNGNPCAMQRYARSLIHEFIGISYRRLAKTVVPAQAGIHNKVVTCTSVWIPACAGMTGFPFHSMRNPLTAFPLLAEKSEESNND